MKKLALIILFLLIMPSMVFSQWSRQRDNTHRDGSSYLDSTGGQKKVGSDSLKIDLTYNMPVLGFFRYGIKYDTSGFYTDPDSGGFSAGKLPKIRVKWGYYNPLTNELLYHADSSRAFFQIEDSVKGINTWRRFLIEPDAESGLMFVAEFNDADTSAVSYRRRAKIWQEVIIF